MTPEIAWLVLAVMIGLAHLVWHAAAAQPQRGSLAWNAGPRDEPRPLTGMAARLERAFANFRETFPFFLASIAAVCLAGRAGGPCSLWGGGLYVVLRAAYLPLYGFGVPYLRSVVWLGSMAGIGLTLCALI